MSIINTTESAIRERAAKLGVRRVKNDELSTESCKVYHYIEDGSPLHVIASEWIGDVATMRYAPVKELTLKQAYAALDAAFSLPGNPVTSHATFLLNRCFAILASADAHLLLKGQKVPVHGRPKENQARDEAIIRALAYAWSLGVRKEKRRVADRYGLSEERVKEIMEANKTRLKTVKARQIDGILRLVESGQEETVRFWVSGITVAVKRGV